MMSSLGSSPHQERSAREKKIGRSIWLMPDAGADLLIRYVLNVLLFMRNNWYNQPAIFTLGRCSTCPSAISLSVKLANAGKIAFHSIVASPLLIITCAMKCVLHVVSSGCFRLHDAPSCDHENCWSRGTSGCSVPHSQVSILTSISPAALCSGHQCPALNCLDVAQPKHRKRLICVHSDTLCPTNGSLYRVVHVPLTHCEMTTS